MFSLIKDKFQSVQDNLSTSFRGLKIADTSGFNSARKLPVDINAGADLLHKYQTEWEEMHIMAEENALAAQKVDATIGLLHSESRQHCQRATQLTSALSSLPLLAAKTDDIIYQIEKLQSLVVVVEDTLLELADTIENKKHQEQQLESRYQLAIHSEQRLAQLDILRGGVRTMKSSLPLDLVPAVTTEKLSEEHRQKVIQFEKKFERKQKERQATFAKAFEEDLHTYKQTGKVPTIRPPLESGPCLEEVELDVDTEALDRMLDE